VVRVAGDRQYQIPTGQIPGMQIGNVGCHDLSDEAQLIRGSCILARRQGVLELVDELLAIMQVAQDILGLFQGGNGPGCSNGAGGLGDFHHVAQFFDCDPGGVGSMWEVHSRRVANGICGALRPVTENRLQLLPPSSAKRRAWWLQMLLFMALGVLLGGGGLKLVSVLFFPS